MICSLWDLFPLDFRFTLQQLLSNLNAIFRIILFLSALSFCPVGEAAHAEEAVHADHPAGPEGEGELPEGEDQPADDAPAGETEKP